MTQVEATTTSSAERVLQAAAALFSERGYRGTSIRDIANAVGLNVATVHYHIGSKQELYRRIIKELYEQEQRMIADVLTAADEAVTSDPKALRELLANLAGAFIQRAIDYPEAVRIWAFRWLHDSSQFEDLEALYSLPLYQSVLNLLLQARAAGVVREDEAHLRMFLVGFMWLLYGYFTGRKNDWGEEAYSPYSPNHVRQFRRFVRQYLDRMLTYSDSPTHTTPQEGDPP